MGRSQETFGKKEVKSKQEKKRKDKLKRKQERKELGKKGFDDMIAWVDENGVISNTPPDPDQKKEVKAEHIAVSVPKATERVNNNIRTGRLKTYNEEKGFGFLFDEASKDSIFVHVNDCEGDLVAGGRYEFETEKGLKGLKAVRVKAVK